MLPPNPRGPLRRPLRSSLRPPPSTRGLLEIARLGRDNAKGEPVRTAAAALLTIGTNLSQALGTAEPAATAAPSPDMLATIRDVGARTGADLDPAWLRAASDILAGTDTATDDVLASAEVPAAVKDAVREAVSGVDAARAELRAAGVSAGAAPPTLVQAGDGGLTGDQSTWITVAGIALVGLGGAMLGGAAVRRRARR